MYIEAFEVMSSSGKTDLTEGTHLIPHILLKILVSSNIEAYTSILQPFRFDLIRRTRNCRNNHIRYSKALL